MTVMESIIAFLGQYEDEEIKVDKLDSSTASYTLMKAPQEEVETYISGLEIHKEHYQLMARLDSQSEAERIENQAWGQGITEWIRKKNLAGEYPALDGYRCTGIGVSSPFYMGVTENKSAVYQMTVYIQYEGNPFE